jgi:hypothetical protein
MDAEWHITKIIPSQTDPLARQVSAGLSALLRKEQIGIYLGEF